MIRRIKTWWDGPRSSYQVHRVLLWSWILLSIPTVLFWTTSVPYLVFISVYAVIGFHVVAVKESQAVLNEEEQPRFRYRRKSPPSLRK